MALSIARRLGRRIIGFLLLSFAAAAANAHLSGFTDTSIQIAQPGVKIIYTLPADNLLELKQQRSTPTPDAPHAYADAVLQGWSVQAKKRPCFLQSTDARALRSIESYQYILEFECPQGFDELVIRYTLFGEQWRGEQNFTRVFMAGEQLRMRYTFDRKELRIPVPELLRSWSKPLSSGFFGVDPNHRLRKDSWTGFAGTDATEQSSWWQSVVRADPAFITLGLRHILEGADHVLFVAGLLLVPAGWARLAGLVTAFTAAHSITLSLAAYQIVKLPPAITEPLIALTVVAIGIENLLRTRWQITTATNVAQLRSARSRRWLATFGFGLIHGIGLSYALAEMGLADDLAGTLLYFNLGVELGQLCIVAVCLPLVVWLLRQPWGLRACSVMSAALSLIGAYWFVSRMLE